MMEASAANTRNTTLNARTIWVIRHHRAAAPGPSSTWSSTQLLSRWTAGSRRANGPGRLMMDVEPGLLGFPDPVVLGDAGLPAVHVLLHAGLEVRPRLRRPGEAEADLEPGARRPERKDPEPPHAVLRARELGRRVEHGEVGPLGGASREAGDRRKRRRLARQDGDARLLRDVNGVPVAAAVLLDRVLLSEARVVDGPGVVLLHGVLHEKLPVAGDVVVEAAHAPHLAELVRAELGREIAEVLDHAGARLGEAQEDEPLPGLGAHRGQPQSARSNPGRSCIPGAPSNRPSGPWSMRGRGTRSSGSGHGRPAGARPGGGSC